MKKRARFSAKKLQRVNAQLTRWCNGKERVALIITGNFFDLTFAGPLKLAPSKGGFVFESPDGPVLSRIIPIVFSDFEIKETGGRVKVTMRREEGQVTIIQIDTMADLLEKLPTISSYVH
jgi:hypothetical protein